jgi:alpha-amylase/alpha-mannosidase (GH57 family)
MLLMDQVDMPVIRLLFLWHMHQPYYKDLVTGEYRLPWVRLHALKDYYGMVKLLEEFPEVHATFNLVPSLIAQIQDYVAGTASDPFLDVVAKPAGELSSSERLFAVQYLFQAHLTNMIGRYPRYRELWQEVGMGLEAAPALAPRLAERDLTDLQVLSQIAWMDEFFLDAPEIKELVRKGRDYSLDDQQIVIRKQKEFLRKVLPEYKAAAKRGGVEISTSPYYHPIVPLVCDTNLGAISHPGLPLPSARFRHPEDAREQIARGTALFEQVFGFRPRGMWPSEGSVSDETLALAHDLGFEWLASDEGVLGRSINASFSRDTTGTLEPAAAEKLFQVYRWERAGKSMHMLFRDHALSDLIGFVYSKVHAGEAAEDFIRRLKKSAEPLLKKGRDAVVSIILDGENAWEFYPQSGREFLRRLYHAIQKDSALEALTVSEAVSRATSPQRMGSIFPGSWINANFDVWIGAPEDNRSWDHLAAARDFYEEHAAQASAAKKALAYEELLIAEGSDWNWWYGPDHHSANDRDFDELYRKHLANVYQALEAAPPHALAQPISRAAGKPRFTPQTAYIHPLIDGRDIGYFDWLGAAVHVADHHSSAMHGTPCLLNTGYAGVDEDNVYCRLDFTEPPAQWSGSATQLVLSLEPLADDASAPAYRLETEILAGRIQSWTFGKDEKAKKAMESDSIRVGLESIFECQVPLVLLGATAGSALKIRFSLWRDRLPLDALPQEGAIEVHVAPEHELTPLPYAKP